MSIWKTCLKLTAFNLAVLLSATEMILNANQNCCQPDCCQYVQECKTSACCDKNTFYARGEVLYWTPRVTGMELEFGRASIVESSLDPTQVLTTRELDVDPKYKWNAGYRIAAGFETCNWQIEAIWTSFHGKGDRRNTTNIAGNINHGHVKLNLEQIDLTLGYNSNMSGCFNIQPFLGMRATRIRERVRALAFTDLTLVENPLALETRTFDDHQKYWGVGPVFGVNADYEIGCGFGVYGTVAASLLYGDYNLKFDDTDIFTPPVSIQMFSRNKVHTHAFNYNVDLALGLSWRTVICQQFEVGMKLGFEQHQYFDLNRLSVGRGDISFTGGVFALEVGF